MCWLCLKASVIGFDTLASIINCTPLICHVVDLIRLRNSCPCARIQYKLRCFWNSHLQYAYNPFQICLVPWLRHYVEWAENFITSLKLELKFCVVYWIFLWVLITIQVKYMFLELILFGDFVILCNFVCLWLLLLQYLEIVLPLDGTKDFGNRANRCSLICQVWSPNGSLQLQDNRIICCSFVGILRWTNETSLAFFCHF